ncbi:hypothetical protein [Roseomonas fluvialis]|uniref:Glycosyltransferase RgtA/B/C/D-like domain-containing protein n=1 Tax=Roseomonas fluvialis TaxID=1750527 RepID=A0ABM7XY35_9PROT|nr:hypothetical protein [Roseomonas fluvialis]BDG70395.1 hypothetical protein Rmf_03240 [Roseomonas fluvialis]
MILLAIVVALGATLRAFLPGARAGMAVAAGAAYGFGLWVGPEVVLVAVPVLATAGIVAVIAPDGRTAARQGLLVASGMAAMLAAAIVVEHAPAQWAVVAYDVVTVHHLVLALLMAAVFAVAWQAGAAPCRWRVVLSGGAGLVAFALLVALYPDMLRGPLGSADAQALASFVPFVEEIRTLPPLGPGSLAEPIILFGGAVPLGLAGILLGAPGWWRDGRWPAGMVLAGALLVTLAAAFLARRFALDLAAPAPVAGAGVVGLLVHAAWPRAAVTRALLAAAVFFGALALPYAGLALPQAPRPAARAGGCDWTAMAHWLDAARPAVTPGDPAPILMTADLFHGAEVAWRTPYRIVALAHHRAGPAIADTVAVLESPDAAALGVLQRRGVRLLLACPTDPWPAARRGAVSEAIRGGRPVAGLTPVPLPADLGGFRLFAVVAGP